LECRAEVLDVLVGLPDDEVAERVDVPVREQVSLRQGDDPDARKLDQAAFAGQQVFPELQQSLAEVRQQRLEVPLLLALVVQQPLPIHQQERDVGTQQGPERVDTSVGLLLAVRRLFEPFTRVVVPSKAQDVEWPLLRFGLATTLQFQREIVGRCRESGRRGRRRVVSHADVVLVEPIAQAGVLGDQVPEVVRGRPLLRRTEERGGQHGLP
jgi:hypothetical protein